MSGDARSPKPGVRYHKWFVTAMFADWEHQGGSVIEVPASVAHAKTMGTRVTACGLITDSWTKFFDVAFPPSGLDTCETCLSESRHPT